ncbi:MAG: mycofactocin glycosyltransferase [Baekduia sp.]|jgi:mycofactocin system glycosyltransferase|nr:mycofactocin glycosyltransferase [Baekduia sp.]
MSAAAPTQAPGPTATPLLPAGWRLRRAPGVRTPGDGTVLLGGAPLHVLKLSPAGADLVARWWAGEPVGEGPAARRLARRLLDAGLAHPDPSPGPPPQQLTVVVPAHDRPGELCRCLAAIDRRCPIVVVDDGSRDGSAIAAVASAAGATCVRLTPARGPSAARNAGLRAVQTEYVAFVDSDCVVPSGFPGRLLDHLADPALAVVAPRIVALGDPGHGLVARYEVHHSALDMGPREGLVQAGSAIPYAPSAALVARTEAVVDGFDETLFMGEDVDLLWRVRRAGWQIRYDPSISVAHDHRVRPGPWFVRRIAYNESNAPLLRRHPGNVPALSISRSSAAFWTALACRSPIGAAVASAISAVVLGRTLRRHVPAPGRVAARLVLQGHLHEGRHLGRTLTGPWLPFLLATSIVSPRVGRRLWLGVAAGAIAEWAAERHEPSPVHYALPKAADDLARCLGVWRGCWRERTVRPLLPQLRRH